MFGRFGRRRRRAPDRERGSDVAASGPRGRTASSLEPPAEAVRPPTHGEAPAPLPEQPIPLPPPVGVRRAKVGVVLPARRSLLPALPFEVPRVPKRAIFAAGICAGLAAPSLTRELAGRALTAALGPGRRASPSVEGWETATVEIIRVIYAGPRGGQAAAAVGKILERLGR
jgi:hypothetical protein